MRRIRDIRNFFARSAGSRLNFIHLQNHVSCIADKTFFRPCGVVPRLCGKGAGRRLCRQRPGDRPPDAAAGRLCRRSARRAGTTRRIDRFAGTLPPRAGAGGYFPPLGLVRGVQDRRHARIPRFGRHAVHRNRNGGGCHAARSRDGRAFAVPRHGRKPRRAAGHRGAGDRKEPRRQPRRVAYRTFVPRRVVLARGLSQRPDRARRRPVGKQVLSGRHRNPQYQPFRHAGRHGRPREHPQCRPDPRDQFLHRGFPGRPFRGAEFGAGHPTAGREPRKTDFQGDTRGFGGVAERERPYRRENILPLLAAPVLPATAVQDDRPAFPAELHRRAAEGQDAPFGARRADGIGAGGLRQHETQPRRGGRRRRVPAELPAPHPPGDLHRRGRMAPLCGPPCADRVARAHLPE